MDVEMIISEIDEFKGVLETRRFTIPYRVYGKKEKTIIFINGAQQSMGMWRPIVPAFKEDFRVIIFDFPGQGRARILSGPTVVSFEEQIEILHDLILATGAHHNLHLVSASWGAIIVMGFAEKFPDMVKKMILASFGTKPNDHMRHLMKEVTELIEKGEKTKIADTLINGFGENLPEQFKMAIRSQFKNIDEKHLLTFRDHIEFVNKVEDVAKVIKPENIKTKTLLVNGDKDKIINIDDNREFVEKMPDCDWRIIENTGHFMVFENFGLIPIFKQFLIS